MNCKAKGSRNERKARDILKDLGYSLVVRSGASLGVFDLVALSVEYDHALRVQIKTNRKPSGSEMDRLKAFHVPKFCQKQLWIFRDRFKCPEIVEL
jgi:Holliday junction resolvase